MERFGQVFSNTHAMVAQLDISLEALQDNPNMPADWKNLLNDYSPQMKERVERDKAEPGEAGVTSAAEGSGLGDALIPLKLLQEDVLVKKDRPVNAYSVTMPQAMPCGLMLLLGVLLFVAGSRLLRLES